MRKLSADEIDTLEHRAHALMMRRVISICAQVTKRSFRETCSSFEFPDLRELLTDPCNANGYLDVWEQAVGKVAMDSEFLTAGDLAVHVIAEFTATQLVTHIYVYEETDIEDD